MPPSSPALSPAVEARAGIEPACADLQSRTGHSVSSGMAEVRGSWMLSSAQDGALGSKVPLRSPAYPPLGYAPFMVKQGAE